MLTLFVLLGLTVLGIYLLVKSHGYSFPGFILTAVFGLTLFIHCSIFFGKEHCYGLFLSKKNVLEVTLKQSRELGNKYETATIIKEVVQWNTKLAALKYENKSRFLGQYIDDRIETLEPIR